MKEKEFISEIKNILNSDFIGDDCAYLKDLGIVITQDSLVEDVHFKQAYSTPYQLGFKSVMVNLSDVAASGAEAKYLTISLSLPTDIENDFVKNFYEGAKEACGANVDIVGGDITGGDKIYISVCALGSVNERNISSRKNAQIGQKVIVSGVHGSSAAGLKQLLSGERNTKLIKSHLEPIAQIAFGEYISKNVKGKYAMMDTSDGLADALSTIANESGVLLDIDFSKIPYDKSLECFENWREMVLFGGEDYQIVATVPQNIDIGYKIGVVKEGLGLNINYNNKSIFYSKEDVETRVFNHFN